MVKIISFDLDGTLTKPDFGDLVWLEGLPKAYANEKNIALSKAKKQLIQAYDEIGKTKREWYDLSYWIKKLHLSIQPQDLLHQYKDRIKAYPEAASVVANLSKSYSLIISSSAMKEFISIELSQSNMSSYFSYVFSSTSDTDTVKKNPSFYKMICSRLNISTDDLIHVGDSKRLDYESPRKIGITSFYLQRDKQSKKQFYVSSLKEFENRITQQL
ncbi:MAG: HAD family hydrolase [Thermoplasmatota archaeon]